MKQLMILLLVTLISFVNVKAEDTGIPPLIPTVGFSADEKAVWDEYNELIKTIYENERADLLLGTHDADRSTYLPTAARILSKSKLGKAKIVELLEAQRAELHKLWKLGKFSIAQGNTTDADYQFVKGVVILANVQLYIIKQVK